jgi:hypothetical protein
MADVIADAAALPRATMDATGCISHPCLILPSSNFASFFIFLSPQFSNPSPSLAGPLAAVTTTVTVVTVGALLHPGAALLPVEVVAGPGLHTVVAVAAMEEAVTDHLLAEAILVEAGDELPRLVTDHPVLALRENDSSGKRVLSNAESASLKDRRRTK